MFGLPFMLTIVGGSFALGSLTQTRYDLRDTKVHAITKEEELGMKKNRKKIDIREEYFRLSMSGEELAEWENKRVERLPGQGDFGEEPSKLLNTGRESSNQEKVEQTKL